MDKWTIALINMITSEIIAQLTCMVMLHKRGSGQLVKH